MIQSPTPAKAKTTKFSRLLSLVLILIILYLAAVIILPPNLCAGCSQPKREATIADIRGLKSAVNAFQTDTRRLPTQQEGLSALVVRPTDVTDYHGPYVDKLSPDKWGTDYQYILTPDTDGNLPFNIISAGKDQHFGTQDDIDIYTDK